MFTFDNPMEVAILLFYEKPSFVFAFIGKQNKALFTLSLLSSTFISPLFHAENRDRIGQVVPELCLDH